MVYIVGLAFCFICLHLIRCHMCQWQEIRSGLCSTNQGNEAGRVEDDEKPGEETPNLSLHSQP